MSIYHNLLIHPVGWEVSLGKGHSPISLSPSWGIFTANHERLWMTKKARTDGKWWRDTRYYAEPFEAPEWRAQWVEQMEQE